MKKLNLGCGTDIRKGWVNLDKAKLKGVDVVHDISILPLPFKDNDFDYILCNDVLEHFDDISSLLKELFRILKKKGIIEIRVPHFSSRYNFIDPTHKKLFSFQTFEFFVKNSYANRTYYFDFHFDKIIYSKITFEKGIFFYNYLVELFVNLSPFFKELFEATFLSRIFPAANIIVKLKK